MDLLSPLPIQVHPQKKDVRCQMCGENLPKYRCPRCEVRTCSLPCVKKHKSLKECSGVRDKTAYVKVKEFTDLDLLSDYRFLEDGATTVDRAERDASSRYRDKPHWIKKLNTMTRARGVNLKIMPNGFSKRKTNSTLYNNRLKTVFWHVEWVFPEMEAKHHQRRISEHELLKDTYDSLYENPVLKQKLKFYTKAGLEETKFFMKAEGRRANAAGYYQLDLNKKLCDNFMNKTIVEYPTIYVVTRPRWEKYHRLDDLEDGECEEADSSSEESSDDMEVTKATEDNNNAKTRENDSSGVTAGDDMISCDSNLTVAGVPSVEAAGTLDSEQDGCVSKDNTVQSERP